MEGDVLKVRDVLVEGSSPTGGMISVWTLNRPDKLNALNAEIHQSIKNECLRAESNDQIRCIVIRGAPPSIPPEGKRAKPHAFASYVLLLP